MTLGHGPVGALFVVIFSDVFGLFLVCFSIRWGLVGHTLVRWFPSPSFPLLGAVLHYASDGGEGAASFPSGGWLVFSGRRRLEGNRYWYDSRRLSHSSEGGEIKQATH